MHTRLFFRTICASTVLVLASFVSCQQAAANNNNDGGGFQQPIAGIEINAAGVLQMRRVDPQVSAQRMAAAVNRLNPQVAAKSKLRKVSLNRLEAAIQAKLTKGEPISEEMQAVAGLTGVEYVFFYPESGDIVLAGAAEGFAEDAAGCMRGIFTGRPTVLLEDLVVALRAYAPEGQQTSVISVSIDPTPEGLARMQQFLSSLRGQASRAATERIARGLKDNLGYQNVTIKGIPAETHFAQVLVEADYRMKLIGIGLETFERYPGKIRTFKSYVARATPGLISANSMERWFFMPNYDCVKVSEDGLAMRLTGNGVKLIGANELVTGDGQRAASAKVNGASQMFCKDFTDNYPEIAQNIPVYAQLKNLIDLSIASAFIRQQDYYSQSGWNMEILANEQAFPVCTKTAPHQVETAVNAIWRGNTLMTPLGGGIQMQPRLALRTDTIGKDDGQATATRSAQDLSGLAAGQWWWD